MRLGIVLLSLVAAVSGLARAAAVATAGPSPARLQGVTEGDGAGAGAQSPAAPGPEEEKGERGKGEEDEEDEEVNTHRAAAVVEAFRHSWTGYKTYAWGADELLPVSNQPGYSRWVTGHPLGHPQETDESKQRVGRDDRRCAQHGGYHGAGGRGVRLPGPPGLGGFHDHDDQRHCQSV